MKVQIIGVGVVGSAQAYLASRLGHDVLGFDHHRSSFEYARMLATPDKTADVTFVCTPEAAVPDAVAQLVDSGIGGVYVIKSTVPPRTTHSLMQRHAIHISHNPEFLREATAFEDVMRPSAVVIGQCCRKHGDFLTRFYSPLGCPVIITDPTTSEFVKLTMNAYLSTLISFWNEIDKIAAATPVSTAEVARITRSNPRVGAYGTTFFGSPFGGKCLPKDMDQLIAFGHEAGTNPFLFEAIRDFNRRLEHTDAI